MSVLVGTLLDDTLTGDAGDDNTIFGDAASTLGFRSQAGNDTLTGGANGSNTILGDAPSAIQIGSSGNDVVTGGESSTNTLVGDLDNFSGSPFPGTSGTSVEHYEWEDSVANTEEGRSSYRENTGPQGEPAGGVARASDASKWHNTEGYRNTVRVAGQSLELYALVQSAENVHMAVRRDISEGTGGKQTVNQVLIEAAGWDAAILVGSETAVWGAACGPYAPICMPIFGLVGGGIGYWAGASAVANVIGH
jgi:Ca2+-binding RTX toxin-like protein